MKRFLLFASYEKYDHGKGWEDFRGDYNSARTALNHVSILFAWWHIVDTQTMQIIKSSD